MLHRPSVPFTKQNNHSFRIRCRSNPIARLTIGIECVTQWLMSDHLCVHGKAIQLYGDFDTESSVARERTKTQNKVKKCLLFFSSFAFVFFFVLRRDCGMQWREQFGQFHSDQVHLNWSHVDTTCVCSARYMSKFGPSGYFLSTIIVTTTPYSPVFFIATIYTMRKYHC